METNYPKLTELEAVQTACAAQPEIAPYCRVVGRWIWAEFPDKPCEEVRRFLKQTGFRWNKDRLAWQHSCGVFTRRNTRIDPRQYYGQQPLSFEEPERQETPRPSHIEAELSRFTTV